MAPRMRRIKVTPCYSRLGSRAEEMPVPFLTAPSCICPMHSCHPHCSPMASYSTSPQLVLVAGVASTPVQDIALGFVEPQEVFLIPLLGPVKGTPHGILSPERVDCTTQLWVSRPQKLNHQLMLVKLFSVDKNDPHISKSNVWSCKQILNSKIRSRLFNGLS